MKNTLVLAVAMLLSAPAAADSDWGMFRGPNRDGHSPDTGLLKQWPSTGPALAWKVTGLGKGASSFSIVGDKMYTMGDLADGCHLICLSAADGKIAWTTKMGAPWVDEKWLHGPRGTPATDGALVIGLSPNGDVLCADAATGKEKWKKSMKGDFGGKMMSGWGFSESPLLDGDHVVITPGGSKGTVAALKKATGELVWQSSGLTDSAAYASLVPVEIGGVRQYLLLTDQSAAGIGAKDGKVLWRVGRQGKTAVIPTPVYKDGIVFVTSGYGVGCSAYKITEAGGAFTAAELYVGTQMKNHHGGVILVGDYVYGLDDPGTLKCIELKTGKVVWQDKSIGKGAIAFADGHFVLRSENEKKGDIALIEASPEGYKETGRFTQPDLSGKKCWAHPVVFGGKMYIRDHDLLLCYDVKAK